MNTLEFAQSLRDSLCIGSTIIAGISIAWLVSTLLRNYEIRHELKKLKKWRKFSEIEKKQKHEEYDRLATELAEERKFSDTQGDMHVRLLLKYAGIQEESEKLKKELKIAQTCLKVAETEIAELKSKLERKRNEKGQFIKKADQERDWTTATKDELLAEAKRRYPVGTKVKGNLFPFDREFVREDELRYYDNCEGISAFGEPWVYSSGKWAEIIPNA